MEAAPQHERRPEDARHAHRVGQSEGRQQHESLQYRGDRPGERQRGRPQEERDDRDAVLQRVGGHARYSGVDRHADPAALVRVVIDLVAIDPFDERQDIDAESERERAVVRGRMRRVPKREVTHRVDADQVERGGGGEHQHRRRGEKGDGVQPLVPGELR